MVVRDSVSAVELMEVQGHGRGGIEKWGATVGRSGPYPDVPGAVVSRSFGAG
jgi:hypothetical protein